MKRINLRRRFVARPQFFTAPPLVVTQINIRRRSVIEMQGGSEFDAAGKHVRRRLVGLLANGCVVSLLITPTGDLIQPRNRCLGQVLTGGVDNCGIGRLIGPLAMENAEGRQIPMVFDVIGRSETTRAI